MFPKLRKLFLALLIIVIILGVFSIKHFVMIRWITGGARVVGRSISATVYTNGQINNSVKVYHVDKYWSGVSTDDFILHFTDFDTDSTIQTIRVERKANKVSRPSTTSRGHVDVIAGFLFQSDMGRLYTPFNDDLKGMGFDPQLTLPEHKLKFLLPPFYSEKLHCDSILVEL